MKIFYAVQATGNGHISRAIEVLPILSAYGEVDVFLSGRNASLVPPFEVAYRSKGVGLFYDQYMGKIDLVKTLKSFNLASLYSQARDLPVEKYDLVINDFEAITSLSCKLKKVDSVHFGHQASFTSALVPRPEKKNVLGEWILTHFVSAERSVGLHFSGYDRNIYPPIISSEILCATPRDLGHITVYLGHYEDKVLVHYLQQIKRFRFQVFSTTCTMPYTVSNIDVLPVDKTAFMASLIDCHGVITGAGFETPAEALFMHKKLMVIPLTGQYEQMCNAAALAGFGVIVLPRLDDYFPVYFNKWIFDMAHPRLEEIGNTRTIVEAVVNGLDS